MLDDHCSGLEKGYSNFAADESIKEIMKNEKNDTSKNWGFSHRIRSSGSSFLSPFRTARESSSSSKNNASALMAWSPFSISPLCFTALFKCWHLVKKEEGLPNWFNRWNRWKPQDVWNYFPRFRLHILVHDLDDWDPKLWRRQLGTSFTGVFGGLHWCGSAT